MSFDPKIQFPCGVAKLQPVTLKANLEHYRLCNHPSCKVRLEAYERVKAAVKTAVRR